MPAREVFAAEGTYADPSADLRHWPQQAGGDHNLKGHAVLAFFDLRLGVAVDAPMSEQSEIHTRH